MRKITLYRDDSTVQVVFENVKTIFWTADNTVLVISKYNGINTKEHHYIHWPRERFCWFKDEPAQEPIDQYGPVTGVAYVNDKDGFKWDPNLKVSGKPDTRWK